MSMLFEHLWRWCVITPRVRQSWKHAPSRSWEM